MSTLFGKLVRKVAEAALEELVKPDHQRREEAIRRAMKKERKAQRADEAFARLLDELPRQFGRRTSPFGDHRQDRAGFGDDESARSGASGSRRHAWAPTPMPRENVTAVLRRQVPPRDEPPRSWIGGLPMLPDAIEWPRARNSDYRDAGEIPLNFAAQIACAQLPKDLWGGLGPREGWLVFFLATWGSGSFEDEGSIRVFHTHELGAERRPPADKISVGDPGMSGGDNPALNYERWPVDIIAFPNQAAYPSATPWTGDEPVSPIPPDFENVLYEGAPVATEFWRPCEEPFTWGAVATMLERTAAKRARRPARVREVPRLPADGRDRALAAIAEEEARLVELQLKTIDPDREERRDRYIAQSRAELAQQRAILHQAGDPFDPELLAVMIERSQEERRSWVEEQEAVMESLLAEARSHSPRTWLSASDRSRIADRLSASHGQWHMGTVTPSNRVPCPEYTTLTLGHLVKNERARSVAIAARDLYSAGPQERASLPDDMRLALEADLRRLEDNRPHRLGGIHQPVQESVAPEGKVLLLQLGTDGPTGFSWGDSGAMFAWIGIDALARGDFSVIEWWTENT